MQEVVRAEVLKLLQAGIIYPISDSTWESPTQVVPKKSGVTTVHNEKGEEIPTRLTTGWRVCIHYRRLNKVTQKDHFPLPFMDPLLERISGYPFYCLLDGYSGYSKLRLLQRTKKRQPSHAHLAHMHIGGCPLAFVMPLPHFNDVVVDHLSRLTIAHNTHNPPIYDEFPEESLLTVDSAPWFAHIANF